MLRELQKPLATARGDLSEGINAAMALIKEHTVSKKTGKPLKYEKNIYCFSDGQTEFDTSLLSDSIATLQDEQVDFTMCGFGFEDSQKEELNSDTDAEENSPPLKLSAQQEALLNFVHGKNPDLGSFFTGEEAMAFIDSATTKKVKPTTTYRGSLTFGNAKEHGSAALTMNVFVYPKIMELKLPSAKKISLISRDLTDGGVVQALSTPYLVKENYDSDEDDEEADVDELDREFETVKAYRYGKHLIPFALGINF